MDAERRRELMMEKLGEITERARQLQAGEALGQLAEQVLELSAARDAAGEALPHALLDAVAALLVERQQTDDEVRSRLERLEAATGLSHPPGLPLVGMSRFGHEQPKLDMRVTQLEQWAKKQGSPDHRGSEPLPPHLLHPPTVDEMVNEQPPSFEAMDAMAAKDGSEPDPGFPIYSYEEDPEVQDQGPP